MRCRVGETPPRFRLLRAVQASIEISKSAEGLYFPNIHQPFVDGGDHARIHRHAVDAEDLEFCGILTLPPIRVKASVRPSDVDMDII